MKTLADKVAAQYQNRDALREDLHACCKQGGDEYGKIEMRNICAAPDGHYEVYIFQDGSEIVL